MPSEIKILVFKRKIGIWIEVRIPAHVHFFKSKNDPSIVGQKPEWKKEKIFPILSMKRKKNE